MTQSDPVDPALIEVPLDELRLAYPTSELLSRPVLNHNGDKVGWIEDLLMRDDHLAYAIITVGDFVGVPGRRVVVAFEDLAIVDKEFMIPGATPDTINGLTIYDPGHVSVDGMVLPRPRAKEKHAGHLVATAAGEPVSGILTDISSGRR